MAVQTSTRVLTRDLPQHLGAVVTLMGWVHRCRHLGKLAFLILRDRSGLAQAVLEGELAARPLPEESVVAVTGPVALEPRAPGGVEIRVTQLRVLAEPTRPLPFELHRKEVRAGLEVVLEHRAFGLRHPKLGAVLRVQAELVHAFREYLRDQGFLEVRTPKIVATGTEGGASLFPVQYFDRPAYLAQSPQLYKQMLVGAGYERVFEVGPAYRAEDSHTTRHLAEFTSLDVEMAFVESEEELMDLETALLRHMFRAVAERAGECLALWRAEPPEVPDRIERIPVREAREILLRRYRKLTPEGDLDTEGERLICRYVAEAGKGSFVFITQYPESSRPFYACPDPDRPGLTRTFDLLMNGTEITSGGLRIHDPALLVAAMRKRGLQPEHFAPYLEVFELGMPPHGGFAIGAERLTALILGLANAKEAAAFPRDRSRLTP
ncbi:MAG: aspartate--tRNA(Asn) ligase [Firmicutes bacterium]|nr:aspartate--tRNA(Asn) ligase [Bacillota bacterium]